MATKSKTDERTRGQRIGDVFRTTAGLPERSSDAPAHDRDEAQEVTPTFEPDGGYGNGDIEGFDNQPLGHERIPNATEPDPAAIANKGFVNDLDAYDTSKDEAVEAEESAESYAVTDEDATDEDLEENS